MKAFTVDADAVTDGIGVYTKPSPHVVVGGVVVDVAKGAVGRWGRAHTGIIYDADVRWESGRPILCGVTDTTPDGYLVQWTVGHAAARVSMDTGDCNVLAYSFNRHGIAERAVVLAMMYPGQKMHAAVETNRWREELECRLAEGRIAVKVMMEMTK